jgi:hypothetical protein
MNESPLVIVISVGAFVFSISTWIWTWRERQRKDQRDLFLQVYERLLDKDVQRGRRILIQAVRSVDDAKSLLQDRPEDYDLANTAIATLDVAAMYVYQGYIDQKLFMEKWARVYARCLDSGRHFLREREIRDPYTSLDEWQHFLDMGEEAVARFKSA